MYQPSKYSPQYSQPRRIMRGMKSQIGAALVEWIIVFHVFTLLGLGAYQWIVIYEAKTTLNHATFMGARKGSLNNADIDQIRGAIAEYMAPLYAPESGNTVDLVARTGLLPDGTCAPTPHVSGNDEIITLTCHDVTEHSRVQILNPTVEAFQDFAEDVDEDGTAEEIPNVDLNLRSTAVGAESGLNIQDANLLKVEVVYGYRLRVPLVNWIFPAVMRRYAEIGSFEDTLLQQNRIPIRSSSIVRMQTPAVINNAVLTRDEAEGIVDDLDEPAVVREDLPDRPWCGPTGNCDTEPVCTGCSCGV